MLFCVISVACPAVILTAFPLVRPCHPFLLPVTWALEAQTEATGQHCRNKRRIGHSNLAVKDASFFVDLLFVVVVDTKPLKEDFILVTGDSSLIQ